LRTENCPLFAAHNEATARLGVTPISRKPRPVKKIDTLLFWGEKEIRLIEKTLTVFVISHDEDLLKAIPKADYLTPVNLGNLDIPSRFKGEILAENRLFLSKDALNVTTDFVGIVSARLEEREPLGPGFLDLYSMIQGFDNNEIWSPRMRRIESRNQLSFWIECQSGLNPGMGRVLEEIRGLLFPKTQVKGFVFLGNQFITSRSNWIAFVNLWRQALALSEERFGLIPPFTFRCWNCASSQPSGYWRYTRVRHLAFLGERLTPLVFAHLNPISTYRGHSAGLLESPIAHWRVFASLLPRVGRLAPIIWVALKLPRRMRCEICRPNNSPFHNELSQS
jgi:hypothetical protein